MFHQPSILFPSPGKEKKRRAGEGWLITGKMEGNRSTNKQAAGTMERD